MPNRLRRMCVSVILGLLAGCGSQDPPPAVALARHHLQHDDPQLADKLGQEAYAQFWKSPPTIDQHIDTLTACYSQILHR